MVSRQKTFKPMNLQQLYLFPIITDAQILDMDTIHSSLPSVFNTTFHKFRRLLGYIHTNYIITPIINQKPRLSNMMIITETQELDEDMFLDDVGTEACGKVFIGSIGFCVKDEENYSEGK